MKTRTIIIKLTDEPPACSVCVQLTTPAGTLREADVHVVGRDSGTLGYVAGQLVAEAQRLEGLQRVKTGGAA